MISTSSTTDAFDDEVPSSQTRETISFTGRSTMVDLPVKEMVSLVWEEGTSSSNASVVEEVDIMSYVPFMHSRYDSV